MKYFINGDIAFTHIITRKRQTAIASLGVTIGVAIYLFMNSLSSGFTKFSRDEIFKNNAQLKIYKHDELSKPIFDGYDSHRLSVIVNPQITNLTKTLIDPDVLLRRVRNEPYITNAVAQVEFSAFYNRGSTQISGNGNGVNMTEYAAMFNTGKYMVAGSVNSLQGDITGIIIGKGIAEKLNLGLTDDINVSSSYGVSKILRIVGIFYTGNSLTDDTKSYVNVSTAQQFLKQGPSYVTTIYANTPDADKTAEYTRRLRALTSYTVEDWKTTNADLLAGDKTRGTMMTAISFSILLVASFGIYNILSATIAQKINDIAILKATGFSGSDVVMIFILEAVVMGFIGTIAGLLTGALVIGIMSAIYMGGPVGYFPIHFELALFERSFLLGVLITICAGYFPARKAAKVDPVEIFRK